MINTYFNELAQYLKNELPWLDCVGSNVSYFKGQSATFPVSCFDDNCKNTNYLIPSSSKSNILFFEMKGQAKSEMQHCVVQNDLSFNLFFWFNCERMDVFKDGQEIECCEKIDYLQEEIKEKLKKRGATVKGLSYNVSKPFLTEKTMFNPYQNFELTVSSKVITSDCNKSDVVINQKQC